MTFANDLKTQLRSARAIPGQLGLRPHRVWMVIRTLDSEQPGETMNLPSQEEVEITHTGGQPPKVNQLKDERLAIGNLPAGSIEIGPITPPDDADAGNRLHSLVRGDLWNVAGSRNFLRVQGPTGNAFYRISSVTADKATRWMVVAIPMEKVP